MGIKTQLGTGLWVSALCMSLAACGAADPPREDQANASSEALALSYGALDLGAGNVKYSVRLPSGQRYVEVFARKNGVQNTAHAITESGEPNSDGTTTYSYVKTGYAAGDAIQYRFYSYIGPRRFTPGPGEGAWIDFRYGDVATFRTSTATYLLGEQRDSSGRSFNYGVQTTTGSTYITPYSTGWILTKASPGDASVAVQLLDAELVGTFVKKAGSAIYDPVSAYDSYAITTTMSASWLDIAVSPDTAVYPGTAADPTYAEGGHLVTIPTFTGPQTLLTDASVTFAYLIEQKSWSDATLTSAK